MKSNQGFSLIELLVTISIVAILLAAVVPSFSRSIANTHIATVRDNLISSLQFARSEAISRNVAVALCPSTDGANCTASSDWADGWIIYLDEDTGTNSEPPSTGPLKVFEASPKVNILHTGLPNTLNPAVFVRYVPAGFSEYATPAPAQIISICDLDKKADPAAILISASTGQVRTGTKDDDTCPY